ncbi:hypothetical protein I6I98_08775 [Sphingobacterium multivorum]|uniref:ABC-three component systems C-terminal domain-containing protein n=1 Tax=Sphingobacterium multivorum TaxID=28454 RepID=A0ABX7CTC7_SPHMU|nr:ABC-three component system protein [Sphingobacterium multivorum]QQT55331.1 hypothetical protein I6I98_08775 [Sphingobacterium multivorum]
MSDSASGSISGFLFQFEKALVLLATLDNITDVVSIEQVDDVAIQSDEDLVLVTIQSKHSIAPNGTTFEDTSKSLWRTLQIWIEKLEKGIFNDSTKFICSTNKKIAANSLLRKILTESFDDVVQEIKVLLDKQKAKLKGLQTSNKEAGKSIKPIIKLIQFVLSKEEKFRIIKENLIIEDSESLIERFFIATHMTTDNYSQTRKELVYNAMYGWLLSGSKAKWLQGTNIGAGFTKKDFDAKLSIVNANPAIVNAVFRKKDDLGVIDSKRLSEAKKELFVIQIADINRKKSAKERLIENAVLDFIYHDIEMAHIVRGGNFTEPDFRQFQKACIDRWQSYVDTVIVKELEDYDEEEKNEMAVKIFDNVMNNMEVNFQEGFSFNSSNSYIRNGTFLKLSNIPEIGWHPDWESKYKKS